MKTKKYALGIDIGGTNIAFGIVDRKGNVLFEDSKPTQNFTNPIDFINYLFDLKIIQDHLNELEGIGIGAPNGNHFKGTIDYAPNLLWKGCIPLKDMVENKFNIPTQITNDANAAAVGEKIFGCAKDLENFVTITLGTGLGSGIFINNNIVYGEHGYAGEFGHIRVIPNGRLCKCGRNGCLETYASATGVLRSFEELISSHKKNSTLNKIKNLNAKLIFEEAEKGDLFSIEIINFTADILGSALADFTAFSDPKAFILFGGIAQNGENFRKKVAESMKKNTLKIFENKVEIRISSLHDKNAAILGNAASVFLTTK
jgi:glucokinase